MVGVVGCSSKNETTTQTKIIVVDLYPVEFLTKAITGGKFTVMNVIPYGVEPHAVELSLEVRKIIEEGGGFIRVGAGLDSWANKIAKPDTLDLSRVVSLRQNNGVIDPHYWSDCDNLKKMVTAITDYIVAKDPANSSIYRANAATLMQKIGEIDRLYVSTLKGCAKNKIVVTHDAYGYLAARYHLTTLSILGIEPDEEPSLATMNKIRNIMNKEGLKVLFLEEIVSSKIPERIAQETGAKVKVLYSLENLTEADAANGVDLFEMMHRNLDALKDALACRP